jgi:hypothetical protein
MKNENYVKKVPPALLKSFFSLLTRALSHSMLMYETTTTTTVVVVVVGRRKLLILECLAITE